VSEGFFSDSREVGYALSGCRQDFLSFVVFEGEKVSVNNFYFVRHPFNPEIPVLCRVFQVRPYNPEMELGRTGPLAGKKRRRADYGKKLEYTVAFAEVLGYYNERGRWRRMEVAPSPWDAVYQPSEEALSKLLSRQSGGGLTVEVGKIRGTSIPIRLDLNAVAKGHLFVAGQTRSGKSSFTLNLIARSSKLNPKPRFLVFDRRGEYGALERYGAKVIPYIKFTPPIIDPEALTRKLGLKRVEKEAVFMAVTRILKEGRRLSRRSVLEETRRIVDEEGLVKKEETKRKVLEAIKWHLENKGEFIDSTREPLNVIEEIKRSFCIVVDFSVDADIESQQRTATHILKRVVQHAMERKEAGDFACLVVVEEAQYLCPERGFEIVDSPVQSEVKKAFIEAVSQAGGYNVGLIIMTQRPSYVSKSVISQANSVACFRLMSGNDQKAVSDYTEYGGERLEEYLPSLADHEALLWGMAVPTPFPIVAEVKIEEYPRKAATFAKQAWGKMPNPEG